MSTPEAQNQSAIAGSMGVTLQNGVGTIRVYSETASMVELCILNPDEPREVVKSISLQPGDAGIWQATDPDLILGTKYALRVDGPDSPRNRFNSSIFLIDPYAKGVVRESAPNTTAW